MKISATPLMLAAALSAAAAPALAAPAANPAASLSITKAARAGAATRHDGRLGGSGLITYGIIGAIVVLAAVLIATNDTPTSV